jgi:hypothetical protein
MKHNESEKGHRCRLALLGLAITSYVFTCTYKHWLMRVTKQCHSDTCNLVSIRKLPSSIHCIWAKTVDTSMSDQLPVARAMESMQHV